MCDIFDQLLMRDIFILGGDRLCPKSVPPPQIGFFQIVLRQLSECSHEGAVYGVSDTLLFRQTLFSTKLQNVFLECLQVFFLCFARQQESRLFFLHQGFLLSCTLYQLNKTMI